MEGVEPTTCWLQISCSDQLSYIGEITQNGLQKYELIFKLQIIHYFFLIIYLKITSIEIDFLPLPAIKAAFPQIME